METINFMDRTANGWVEPWLKQIDATVEPLFFDQMFACAERDGINKRWIDFLETTTQDIFARASAALPITGARRLKAIAIAERRLGGSFHKQFEGYLTGPDKKEFVHG